jgi:hypothetical protein
VTVPVYNPTSSAWGVWFLYTLGIFISLLLISAVLGIDPKASCMLGCALPLSYIPSPWIFMTGSLYVAQAGPELVILLPPPSKCCIYLFVCMYVYVLFVYFCMTGDGTRVSCWLGKHSTTRATPPNRVLHFCLVWPRTTVLLSPPPCS